MPGTILMAYGSKHGSTQEVAHAVAEELAGARLDVETLPAREVDDLRPYAGVVVGGSIYMGRWHADAVELLKRHTDALADAAARRLRHGAAHARAARRRRALAAAAPVTRQGSRGRAGRRRHLRRRDQPALAPLPVQPHAGERRARLGRDPRLGGRSRR